MINWESVRLQSKCKICNLYNIDKDLFEEIHEMVLHTGFSQSRAMQVANHKLSLINELRAGKGEEGYAFFNKVNFHLHFKNHLPIDIATAVKLRSSAIQAVRPELEETETSLQKHMDQTIQSNLSDYDKLSRLVEKFELRFTELDEMVELKGGMDWNIVQEYSTFIKELSKMRSELIKLKQSDVLMNAVVSQVLQQYTIGSLKGIMVVIDQVYDEIVAMAGKSMAEQITNRLRTAIVDGMQDQARDVVKTVKKQFKLKL